MIYEDEDKDDLKVKKFHGLTKEGEKFDDAYGDFLASKTFEIVKQVDNLYWAESAEFIVDEYYREKEQRDPYK